MSKERLQIALVTGGYTGESAVSRKSAVTVKNHMDKNKFNVYEINIDENGWFYVDDNGTMTSVSVDRNDFSLTIDDKKINFDCVYVCIAGSPGEDGKLQGYFDLLKIRYVGCSRLTSSALTMNKRLTVAVAGFYGIHVSKFVLVEKPVHDPAEILRQVKLPVFVKGNHGGSSLGTSRVDTAEELPAALECGFKEDDQLLIEEAIEGREFTVGVYKAKGKIDTLAITEIVSNNKFFDYNAKYNGEATEITPAKIDPSLENDIRTTAIKVYQLMECSCVARVDFIYNKNDEHLYLLEVNTVPGQTGTSILPQQVKATGLTLTELYTAFIEDALGEQ